MKETNYSIDNMKISYEVTEKGYNIYLDDKIWITQYEPYIPYPELSYEEGCLKQIEDICTPVEEPSVEEQIADLEAQLAALKEQQVNK